MRQEKEGRTHAEIFYLTQTPILFKELIVLTMLMGTNIK